MQNITTHNIGQKFGPPVLLFLGLENAVEGGFYEVFDNAHAIKLQKQFYAEYTPDKNAEAMIAQSEPLRIFELCVNGRGVGFIGIRDLARDRWMGPILNGVQAWCAEIGYTEPAWRHKGLQKVMLDCLIQHHKLQAVCLEGWRMNKCEQDLLKSGLTNAVPFHSVLYYVTTAELWQKIDSTVEHNYC